MSVVVYGKHTGFGDFLSLGLERRAQDVLGSWMQDVLPQTKEMLEPNWNDGWDTAPDLRFWIGPEILGVPLCGIWRASADRVGRRYPLMLGLTGPVSPPPVHPSHDAAPYMALSAHLDTVSARTAGSGGVQSLVAGFDLPPLAGTPYDDSTQGMLWGTRGDDDLDHLFHDAAEADAFCAQYGRSHWWHPGNRLREAGWLSMNGLPNAQAMCWLLTDRLRIGADQDKEQDDAGSGLR